MATTDRPTTAIAAVGLGWPAEPAALTPETGGAGGLGWPAGAIALPEPAEHTPAQAGEQQ